MACSAAERVLWDRLPTFRSASAGQHREAVLAAEGAVEGEDDPSAVGDRLLADQVVGKIRFPGLLMKQSSAFSMAS